MWAQKGKSPELTEGRNSPTYHRFDRINLPNLWPPETKLEGRVRRARWKEDKIKKNKKKSMIKRKGRARER